MKVWCSDKEGIPLKVLKPYISDFCDNHVYTQPGEVASAVMEYPLMDPWNHWTVTFAWSTKLIYGDRNCERDYQALASKEGCGMFETKRGRIVVSTKAQGKEHTGAEKCEYI